MVGIHVCGSCRVVALTKRPSLSIRRRVVHTHTLSIKSHTHSQHQDAQIARLQLCAAKGNRDYFPRRVSAPSGWLWPIYGQGNLNQDIHVGSSPRKSFLFCLTHLRALQPICLAQGFAFCGRAPRLLCASRGYC